ncbi:testis-specific gene 13 protein-like [Hyla sarda]|uniref:testis-specific gene 13 protein-like n=1 Tax=Hyla sarda TaxID=327740 RepID=UPI0024C33A99|nr:testis-specific gene 13 protein-like [Hyla sarda]
MEPIPCMPNQQEEDTFLNLEKMDFSSNFDNMVEKEQETLGTPTKDAEGTVLSRRDEVFEEGTDLEPHVLLLQKVLGEELAQYFLDPSSAVPVNAVHPLLLEKSGQSAKVYWRVLRESSDAQLQEITTLQETPKSSFFAKIPSSKVVDQIQEFRKMLEIMYRASKINQDKAALIMSNNPLPDYDQWQKNESPMEYLYTEVIQTKGHANSKTKNHSDLPSSDHTNSKEDRELNEQVTKAGKKNYRYITQDTFKKYKGEFSQRFRELKHQGLKGTNNITRCIQVPSKNGNVHESARSSATKHAATARTWESLTYTALMDSKPFLTVPGNGDFRHGQPIKWVINSANLD